MKAVYFLINQDENNYTFQNVLKKKRLSSRQPIFIANLKSNTMKNTMQIYRFYVIQHAFSA